MVEHHQVVEAGEGGVRQAGGIAPDGHPLRGGGAGVAEVPDVAPAEAREAGQLAGPEGGEAGLQHRGQVGAFGDELPLEVHGHAALAGDDPLPGIDPEDAVARQMAAALDALEQEAPRAGPPDGQVDGHRREGVGGEGARDGDDVGLPCQLFAGLHVHCVSPWKSVHTGKGPVEKTDGPWIVIRWSLC